MARQLRVAVVISGSCRDNGRVPQCHRCVGARPQAATRQTQAATRQTGVDWIPTGVIAVKLDPNMRRFGRNCDYVLAKRGAQVAQTAATITRLNPGSWRVQVRREKKYVHETFLRRKDAEARQRQDNAMS
jgi:hypothetical protein